jgi:hypothetical protein
MARSRDISKVLSSNSTLATDAEVAAFNYLTQSSASTVYQTKASAGIILLNTTSFTTQSTVSIDNVFSATYDTYIIKGSYEGSVNGGCDIRLRVSGADNSASNYERQLVNVSNASTSFTRLTGQTAWINALHHLTTGNGLSVVEIHRPFSTSPTWAITLGTTEAGATDVRAVNQYYKHTASTSFTGLSMITTSGTITGSISVLGYNK